MTNEELRELNIPLDMAKAAFEHVSARLDYALEMKAVFEARATTLLRVFLGFALAIVGTGATLARVTSEPAIVWPFAIGSAPLFIATASMILALWDRKHGSRGSDPSWWLRPDVIDGDEAEQAYLTACLANDYTDRIDHSFESNRKVLHWLRGGLIASAVTPIALVVALVVLH